MHRNLSPAIGIFWCLIFCSSVKAEQLSILPGSISPNGRLAVAVFLQQPGKYIDETEDKVFLVEAKTKKVISKIPDITSSGGLWGTITKNVRCLWDANGRHLAINFRTGRMNGDARLFRAKHKKLERIALPPDRLVPKGRILEVLRQNSNSGIEFGWDPDGSLIRRTWGLIPKEGNFDEDYGAYGFPDFDQVLEFVYRFQPDGSLMLVDLRTPKREPPK